MEDNKTLTINRNEFFNIECDDTNPDKFCDLSEKIGELTERQHIIQYIKMRLDILNSIDWNELDDNELFIALNNCDSISIYIKKLIDKKY